VHVAVPVNVGGRPQSTQSAPLRNNTRTRRSTGIEPSRLHANKMNYTGRIKAILKSAAAPASCLSWQFASRLRAIILSLMLIALCAVMGSCATVRFNCSVNAIAGPEEPQARAYWLAPGSDQIDPSSLEYLEYSKYVHFALKQRGFEPADSIDNASVIVLFTYEMGEGKTHSYTYSAPVFGQTGVSSSATTGYYNPYSGSYSATTTYTPRFGVVGYRSGAGTTTLYPRTLVLSAHNARDRDAVSVGSAQPSWRVTVVSVGESPDLRRVLPAMVYAAKEHIAGNTGQWTDVTVFEGRPNYSAFKNQAISHDSVASTAVAAEARAGSDKRNSPPDDSKTPKKSAARSAEVAVGTGFFLSRAGIVVTAKHLVIDAYPSGALPAGDPEIPIWVRRRDGVSCRARIVGIAKDDDVALLACYDAAKPTEQSRRTPAPPAAFTLGDLSSPAIGMKVFTIGFPLVSSLGTEPQYSDGAVSRSVDNLGMFQISVPVLPGNSGGPVVDAESGSLVGLAVARAKEDYFIKKHGLIPEGLGWAVSSSRISALISTVDVGDLLRGLDVEALGTDLGGLNAQSQLQRLDRLQLIEFVSMATCMIVVGGSE